MIYSDGWFLNENGEDAWLLSTDYSELFKVNLQKQCFVDYYGSALNDNKITRWRLNNICFNHRDFIYCLPDNSQDIWVYDLELDSWKIIHLPISHDIRVEMRFCGMIDEYSLIFSYGLFELFLLNCSTQELTSVAKLPGEKDEFGEFCFDTDYFHIVSTKRSCIYRINILSGQTEEIFISVENKKWNTICLKEGCFWLTGHDKGIYRYNPRLNDLVYYDASDIIKSYLDLICVKRMNTFDDTMFLKSFCLNGRIWFIPKFSNEIIYIENEQIYTLNIKEEIEDEKSIERELIQKYLIEYVKEQRYIGLYSTKNDWIMEIDTIDLSYRIISYTIDENACEKYIKDSHTIIHEKIVPLTYFIKHIKSEKNL